MEEKKKGGKRAAPNRRGWLLAVLVLAGLGIWGILEWRAHTAPGPGISVNEEALTRREPFYQYDAPASPPGPEWTFPAIKVSWTGPP